MSDNKLTSIQKITTILNFLSRSPYKYKVSEISEGTGINRASVYRILYELIEEGYIFQEEDKGRFGIGASLYHTGMVYLYNAHYQSAIQDVIEEAGVLTMESVGLSARDGDRVISLYETESHQNYKIGYSPGTFYPMNRGCYGKILMAYHDEERVKKLLYSQKFEKVSKNTLTEPEDILREYRDIREQGYAISDEETMQLEVGVGVPIFNSKGEAKYCIAVAFLKNGDYLETIQRFLKILKESGDKISKLIP